MDSRDDRLEHILGASKAELISPKTLGKNTTGRNKWPRLTASCIVKLSEDGPKFQPKLLWIGPILYLEDIMVSFRFQIIFPKYPGYFDNCILDHFSDLEYFGKTVPEI